jgi:hypothetical protein
VTSIQIDRTDGLSSSTAIKGPCRVATTANITLAGEQTIDGVAVVTDDRVLVKDQTNGVDNGIWKVSTGVWSRAKDFSSNRDVKTGTMVNVTSGTAGAGQWQISTTGDISVGTTNIAFTQVVQPYDADLASWAAVTRAAGFDTFTATPSSANLRALLTDDTGTGAAVFAGSPALTGTPTAPTASITTNSTQIATTAFVIQQSKPYNVLWAGADPTNTSDSVAAFVTAEANGDIYIPEGSYKIATNWSPTVGVRRSSAAKFYVADGVTINFAAASFEDKAHKKQVFYFPGTGTGAISNLDISYAGWFAGDNLSTTTNSLTALQKWSGSVASQGELRVGRGYYTTDGSDYIQISAGQNVVGFGPQASKLRFSGAVTKGFRFSTTSGPTIRNIGFDRQDGNTVATSGECLLFESTTSKWQASGLYSSGAFIALRALAGNGKLTQFDFLDTRSTAVNFESCADNFASQGIVAATSSWLVVSGVVGTFVQETITYPGGSGTIFPGAGGKYKVILTTTEPAAAATITGSTSGATATVTSVTHPHSTGGIRLYNQCEAHLFSDIDIVGGSYALLMDAAAYTAGNRPLTCVFTGCLFDSCKTAGAYVGNSVGTKFQGCWFSNRPADNDAYVISSYGTTFTDCEWTNSYKRALLSDTGSEMTIVTGGFIADFNTSNTANTPAVLFAGASSGAVRNVVIGKALGYSGNPTRGVEISAGCVVIVDTVDASLCTTPFVDNSGGLSIIANRSASNTFDYSGATGYTFNAALRPTANDGAALGSATVSWSDVFLASGAVLNFNNGNYTATHSAGTLTFSGGSSWGGALLPTADDGAALGSTTKEWSDLFVASGAVLNFNNGNYTVTHSAGLLTFSGAVLSSSSIKSSSATAGIGYATGAGGSVSQATSKSTGVTLNTATGQITMNAAALAASTTVSFVLTSSAIGSNDLLVLNHIFGGTAGSYTLNARTGAGSATIDVRNVSLGSLSEGIVISYAVIKGVVT